MTKNYKYDGTGNDVTIDSSAVGLNEGVLIELSGSFNNIFINDLGSFNTVQVMPADGKTVTAKRLVVNNCRNVHITGFKRFDVTGTASETGQSTEQPMVRITGENCIVEGLNVFSASVDVATEWNPSEWKREARNGIRLRGRRCYARQNDIYNVRNGIEIMCVEGKAVSNTVMHFFEDGIRAIADKVTVENNSIMVAQDCGTDAIHSDGIQMWDSSGKPSEGILVGVSIINNYIWNRSDLPGSRLLQGIGCFDGVIRDARVVGNIVSTDHEHGITLGVAINSAIEENIVFSTRNDVKKSWIMIGTKKKETHLKSQGNVLAFNSATRYEFNPEMVKEDILNITMTDQQVANMQDFEWADIA